MTAKVDISDGGPRIISPNMTLHWVSPNSWFASRGYDIWHSTTAGESWTRRSEIINRIWTRLARHPLIAQVGRLGIHNLIQLSSGVILVVANGILYRSLDQGYSFSPSFSGFRGRRPLRRGICQDFCGSIFLGEYFVNRSRRAVRLWRSDDDAQSWYPVYTWSAGTIAHIHCVLFDPYEQALWVGTGDEDHECRLLRSRDGGASFETIGAGQQLWRTGSLLFTPEALIWGTDIGYDQRKEQNYIVNMDRATRSLKRIRPISGPAYYSAQTASGTFIIGTCVEQANALNDSHLHLYLSEADGSWQDYRLWSKKAAPKIFGPAMITFPLSDSPLDRLLFNAYLASGKHNGALFELDYRPSAVC